MDGNSLFFDICVFVNYGLLLKRIHKSMKNNSNYLEVEKKLSNTYNANIKICDCIQSPLTFGFIKTTILMPASTLIMTEKRAAVSYLSRENSCKT